MNERQQLKSIIDEIDDLITKKATASSSNFLAWHSKASRFLIKKYGNKSFEYKDFTTRCFSLKVWTTSTPDYRFAEVCANGLRCTKSIFLNYLDEMEESENDTPSHNDNNTNIDMSSVFIVHGHDEGMKQAVARLIEKQGIKATILHERPNQGATIIEKFEKNCNVGAAICLFTPDDLGHEAQKKKNNPRARQNVVFETGYFMGKIGRERVIIIVSKGIELPSDIQGILYTDTDSWKLEVLNGLKSLGYNIDLNKISEGV